MAYQAIARRWRPHKFEDLVGQGHVVQTLKNAIAGGRVSHAYLFSGARGVGKTSVARIFAKALRCPNAQNAVPCNTCSECVAISESRSVDVAEIDGASHNGVEAVRSIRDNVAYSAADGFYKIYIIDEAHMLSLSAFNALLKTLEEPPAHVIFVLATTESQKIPVTILSRCQRFEFRRLTQTQIIDRLKQILAEEKIPLSEGALRTLASHADGSLRDALSLLDQALSHDTSGAEITESQLVNALGISPTSSVTDFWSAVGAQDIPRLLALLQSTHMAGVDLKHFAERCLEELRLLYLIALARETKAPVTAEGLDIASSHFQELEKVASSMQRVAIERRAQILNHAIDQLGWASFPRFVLEMAAVRMTQLEPLAQLENALAGKPTVLANTAPRAPEAVRPVAAPVPVPTPVQSAPAAPNRPAPGIERQATPLSAPPPAPPPIDAPVRSQSPVSASGAPNWQAFIDAVMKKRPLLGALLCHGEFQLLPDKKVVLSFPSGSFYERQGKDTKNRMDTEEQLKAFFGPGFSLTLSSADTVRSLEKNREDETARIKKESLEHPSVLQVKEALGADVVDVNIEV